MFDSGSCLKMLCQNKVVGLMVNKKDGEVGSFAITCCSQC